MRLLPGVRRQGWISGAIVTFKSIDASHILSGWHLKATHIIFITKAHVPQLLVVELLELTGAGRNFRAVRP